MKKTHVYKQNPLNPLNPLEEGDKGLKKKKKRKREGLACDDSNPRNPLQGRACGQWLAGSALANLYARRTLDERRLRAAIEFRETWRLATGGVAAADWMREKVDGGRLFIGPAGGLSSALDADRQCREWLWGSGMGMAAAEVVLRVAGYDEALKFVAMDFEDTPKAVAAAKASFAPSRCAQDYVRRLLRDGLKALADHLYGRERRNDRVLASALQEWLSIDLAR